MASRSSARITLVVLVLPMLLSGCLSYQLLGGVEGAEVPHPGDRLVVGKTTLGETLTLLGAPDAVDRVTGYDLLIYERAITRSNRLAVGIPLAYVWTWRMGLDLAAYGGLVRYDRLILFFNPEGVLSRTAFEQGSSHSYWKAMTSDS